MTPEQEILEDALVAARQRRDRFRLELHDHAGRFPLDPQGDWDEPPHALQMEMAAFTKRYEMTQDLVTRRLFRSVLAVRGVKFRTGKLSEIVEAVAVLGIVSDLTLWDEITKLRNSFAHDYSLTFAGIVPLLNDAWAYAPLLIDMIDRVDRYVAEHRLLEAPNVHD